METFFSACPEPERFVDTEDYSSIRMRGMILREPDTVYGTREEKQQGRYTPFFQRNKKMAILYEICDTIKNYGSGVRITGFSGECRILRVPAVIDGLPVLEIAAHAFSGRQDLREVMIPKSVQRIGVFAFYNCPKLGRIVLTDSVEDYRDGVIRQCPSLREIEVHFTKPGHFEIVREMLQDSDNALCFRLFFCQEGEKSETAGTNLETAGANLETAGANLETAGTKLKTAGANPKTAGTKLKTAGANLETAGAKSGTAGIDAKTAGACSEGDEALLWFPSYLNDFDEDTHSRFIHPRIEGAGFMLRESVGRRNIDFAAYDRDFDRVRCDDRRVSMEIALSRLMVPHRLSPEAEAQYKSYLRDNADWILVFLTERGDTERIRFCADENLIPEVSMEKVLPEALKIAAARRLPEISGILMEYRRKYSPEKPKAKCFLFED